MEIVRENLPAYTEWEKALAEARQRPGPEPIGYNVRGAGAVLGVGRSTIYRLIARGQLDARKVCGRTVVSRASILSYFANVPTAGISSTK